MTIIRNLIRYLASPVFFFLAWLTWELNRRATDMSGMAGMDMSGMAMPQSATILGIHLGPATVSALGSWWLMYFLMAVFHLGPWFDFGKSGR